MRKLGNLVHLSFNLFFHRIEFKLNLLYSHDPHTILVTNLFLNLFLCKKNKKSHKIKIKKAFLVEFFIFQKNCSSQQKVMVQCSLDDMKCHNFTHLNILYDFHFFSIFHFFLLFSHSVNFSLSLISNNK